MKKYPTITLDGKEYPCRPTMGAMLRFKQETGREVTQIGEDSPTDLCTYLWCCVKSASAHEGTPFDLPLLDFADALSPDDLALWSRQLQEASPAGETAGAEKKS